MSRMSAFALAGSITLACLLTACTGTETAKAPLPARPVVTSNKNEPVIFNGQKFLVSFEYKPEASAYDVAVRRSGKALRDRESDRKDAEQVARSALTHYACPSSTKAQRIDDQVAFSKSGEWRSWLRCA